MDYIKNYDTKFRCTGKKFLAGLKTRKLKKQKEIEDYIANIQSYYKYTTLQMFVSGLDKKESELTKTLGKSNTKEINTALNHWIVDQYRNAVFIIDEAHNSKTKNIYLSILRILKHAPNSRLLLLSATPMYDLASDIIYQTS